ncbi:hypothetical protein [Mesoterricola silvestris]|uniref:Lipoprotein n=1 Tax=Mesoterricola silvestris TaxID=2927979 RepID=A0AA48GNF6_9BACT|nr:hypothetical protein [Mesoterricola silvestris]BDU73094.1 hypothetical protein METEAL_22680 [Mesoterricola silvestris]
MRILLAIPVLVAALACGSPKLSRREAEGDIRKDYPVQIVVTIPESASAIKGSPEHARLVALQEAVAAKGAFAVTRKAEGDRETFAFKPGASAPKEASLSAKGYELPAAEAEFVRALRIEYMRDSARVTYQIRLSRPTAWFGLFQTLHPGVRPGETKERHASYRREGRSWVLQNTDETLKKAR